MLLPCALETYLRSLDCFVAVHVQGWSEALNQLPDLQGIIQDLLQLYSLEEHRLVDFGGAQLAFQAFWRLGGGRRSLGCSGQVASGVVIGEAAVFLLFLFTLSVLAGKERLLLISNTALELLVLLWISDSLA